MQFDNTRIVIRERRFADILDLALRVTAAHAGPLLLAALIGILPCAVFNYWLLAADLPVGEDAEDFTGRYLWPLTVLMVWQTPLATTPMTLYLGQALFVERPAVREMLRMFWSRLPQLIFFQVFLRGVIAGWQLYIIWYDGDEGLAALLGFLLIGQWFFLHLLWPYTNEVLLLERNPLRRGKTPAGTLGRTTSLHGQATSEVILRWLVSFAVGWVLLGAYAFSAAYLVKTVLFEYGSADWVCGVYLPLAGWCVLAYFTVVRFLGYLDLRIRTEGWEVRLVMRAEGARIARQLA